MVNDKPHFVCYSFHSNCFSAGQESAEAPVSSLRAFKKTKLQLQRQAAWRLSCWPAKTKDFEAQAAARGFLLFLSQPGQGNECCTDRRNVHLKCCCCSNYLTLHFVDVVAAAAPDVATVQWALFACFTAKMKLKSTRAFLMRIYMF